MEAFSAVFLRHLGAENTKRIKKWLEDHPGEGLKRVNPGMSQDSVPIATGRSTRRQAGSVLARSPWMTRAFSKTEEMDFWVNPTHGFKFTLMNPGFSFN
jgi:hypothetical protein